MMAPDVTLTNTRPEYLIKLADKSGLTRVECARRLGVPPRTFHHHLRSGQAPYLFQFGLEALASASDAQPPTEEQ
jgi:predicted ArsR family transcriptional regulator